MGSENQIDKFKATARDLECNESEKDFDAKLKKIAKEKPAEKSTS